jgi:phage terminase small subunit
MQNPAVSSEDPKEMNRSNQKAFHAQNRTAKRKRFIKEYAVDLNATKAARRAGYSKKTAAAQGSRLLRNVKVREAIDRELAMVAQNTELTAANVIAGVWGIIRRCEKAGFEFQPFGALKGYELLGKHLRLWVDRLKLEGSVKTGEPKPMTVAQMDQRIAELIDKWRTGREQRGSGTSVIAGTSTATAELVRGSEATTS